MTHATLELRLAKRSDDAYTVELRFRAPMSSTESYPFSGAVTRFDWLQLLEVSLDPEAYGRQLTTMLFADREVQAAWVSACAEARGAGATLHVRLGLDANDIALNSLHWETLRNPEHPAGPPLVADERILLSRLPFSRNMVGVALRERERLNILVAVAGPNDLSRYELAPIDIAGEVARIQPLVAEFQPTILARGIGERAATLTAIVDALRYGVDVLYLVAHGDHRNGEGVLWLEREDGASERVTASELATRITALSRRPVLTFLASCRSAAELAALGPSLATAGISVVVAMQDNVAMTTVARLAPAFFRELQRDGNVERALAAARSSVLNQADWWLPVLYSRLVDGRIWLPAEAHKVPRGLSSPFRALDAFTVDDAPFFFGRDALIAEGYERWLASDRRFLAVVGASGSGKSSLAQAGLIPRFIAALRELRHSPAYLIIRPGEHPLRALRDELRRKGVAVDADFAEKLRDDPALLGAALTTWRPSDTSDASVILFLIDQFEELFTLCKDDAERRAFDAALYHLVKQEDGRISVLLTLRSDFYRHIAQLSLRPYIATYQVHVRHLQTAEMEQAIVAPVQKLVGEGPPRFEAGLVQTMVEETGSNPGALPLLEFALSRLWEAGTLDLPTYRDLEGVRGALNQQAEETYRDLPEDEPEAARHLLLQLVQIGESNEDTRRRVALAELTPITRTTEQTRALVQRLATARLITTTSERATGNGNSTEPLVEVSHEALIRGWQRLRHWIEEDREAIRIHRQISEAARRWDEAGRNANDLWVGSLLSTAEEWYPQLAANLTERGQAFYRASLAKRVRSRFLFYGFIAVVFATVVISLLAAQMLQANRELAQANQKIGVASTEEALARQTAEVARGEEGQARQTAVAAQSQVEQLQRQTLSRRLAAESEAARPEMRDLSLLLGVQAVRHAQTHEADLALRRWFVYPIRIKQVLHHHQLNVAILNPDENRILTTSEDGTVKLWDVGTGNLLATLQHEGQVREASWNADGSRILTNSLDGTAKLWDAANGNLLATLQHDDWVNGASWNAGESRILTSSVDGTAKLWEADSGKLLATLQHDDWVRGASWNADESRILTHSEDGTAKLWEAANGNLLATLQHEGEVESEVNEASWNADESRILTTTSWGRIARLWEADSGKLLATLQHDGRVLEASWNADGSRILIASQGGTAKLWDAANGNLLVTLQHGEAEALKASWNADESRILTSGSEDGTAKLWDAATGNLLVTLQHDSRIGHTSWNADGSRILTSSWDGTAKLWNAASGILLATLQHEGGVNEASWNADESRILTSSSDGTAKLWDAANGNLLATLPHEGGVLQASWNADENLIFTASSDDTVRIWESERSLNPGIYLQHESEVKEASWNADESRILTTSQDGTAKLWNAASGILLATLQHEGEVEEASWNADESCILTQSVDGTAKLWNAASGILLATLQHDDPITRASWNAGGSRILTTSSKQDGMLLFDTVKLWEAPSGTLLANIYDGGRRTTLNWNADGSRILTTSHDGTAKLWEAADGNLLATFQHEGQVWEASWNADESRILTLSDDDTAKLWDAANGNLLATFQHEYLWEASWNADGSRILTSGADDMAKLWEADSGKLLATIQHEGGAFEVSWNWNADGSRILTTSENGVAKLWEATNGNLLATLQRDDAVRGASWSADGSRILTTSEDGTARLWEATNGNLLATLQNEGEVSQANWNADESRILTTSENGTAKLWDAANGNLLATLQHEGEVSQANWNADESRILTSSDDGTARVHFFGDELLTFACHSAARNFTLDQWRSYMGALSYRRTCDTAPLHPSYLSDLTARLEAGTLSEADAIVEVTQALSVDGEATPQYQQEAQEIVAGLQAESQEQ